MTAWEVPTPSVKSRRERDKQEMSPHRLCQLSERPPIQPNGDNSNNGFPAPLPLLPRLLAERKLENISDSLPFLAAGFK